MFVEIVGFLELEPTEKKCWDGVCCIVDEEVAIDWVGIGVGWVEEGNI